MTFQFQADQFTKHTNVTASWDDAGRTMNTNTPNGATAGVPGFNEYGYVGGLRVWKKITRNGSTFEHRVYVHAGPNLIAEYNVGVAASTPVQEYVYADQIDSLVMIHRSNNQKLGVTRNRQWSVVGLHDLANGNVVERYAYEMTGKRTIYAPDGTTVRTTSSFGNNFGYTSRWHDEESGLINFRARYYNPLTGEFLSRDPLEFVNGMSLYRGYFGLNGVDPLGLDWLDDYANWWHGDSIGASFVRGAGYGVIGAAAVVGGVVVLTAVGVPASIVTGGLLVVGAVGATILVVDSMIDPTPSNLAENAGLVVGGFGVGRILAVPIMQKLSPTGNQSPKRFSWQHERSQGMYIIPGRPIWPQIATAFGEGPTSAGAFGTIGLGGGIPKGSECVDKVVDVLEDIVPLPELVKTLP